MGGVRLDSLLLVAAGRGLEDIEGLLLCKGVGIPRQGVSGHRNCGTCGLALVYAAVVEGGNLTEAGPSGG